MRDNPKRLYLSSVQAAMPEPRSLLAVQLTRADKDALDLRLLVTVSSSQGLRPKDTDGRREESARGNSLGSIWGREVGGRSSSGAPMAGGSCDARDGRAGNSLGPGWRVCGDPVRWVGRSRRCRQAGSGMARSRAKARLNFSAQGQRRQPACRRVVRPGRRTAAGGSWHPLSQTARSRLWASGRQPGAVGGERPSARRRTSRMAFSIPVADGRLQFEQLPVPGDEAMIAVFGEEGRLGTGRRLHPPDDEPYPPRPGRGCRWSRPQRPSSKECVQASSYRLDEIVQAFVLADGDGEADIHLAATDTTP